MINYFRLVRDVKHPFIDFELERRGLTPEMAAIERMTTHEGRLWEDNYNRVLSEAANELNVRAVYSNTHETRTIYGRDGIKHGVETSSKISIDFYDVPVDAILEGSGIIYRFPEERIRALKEAIGEPVFSVAEKPGYNNIERFGNLTVYNDRPKLTIAVKTGEREWTPIGDSHTLDKLVEMQNVYGASNVAYRPDTLITSRKGIGIGRFRVGTKTDTLYNIVLNEESIAQIWVNGGLVSLNERHLENPNVEIALNAIGRYLFAINPNPPLE